MRKRQLAGCWLLLRLYGAGGRPILRIIQDFLLALCMPQLAVILTDGVAVLSGKSADPVSDERVKSLYLGGKS